MNRLFLDPSLTNQIGEIAPDFALRKPVRSLEFAPHYAYLDGRARLVASRTPRIAIPVIEIPEHNVSYPIV